MHCKAYHCCLKNKIVLEGTPNTVAAVRINARYQSRKEIEAKLKKLKP
jgi:hypothetical protein